MVNIKRISFEKRRRLGGYVFVGPWLLASVVFLIFPAVFSLIISFSNMVDKNYWNLKFAGLEHYMRAFTEDIEFLPKFYETMIDMLINTPMIVIIALIIAVMISREIKFRGFFRSVFFLPVILGTGFVMEQVLGQNIDADAMEVARGILMPKVVQDYLGPTAIGYISEFFSRITLVMWKSGVQIIISLAGIQSISPSLYESARVDSATEWEMFWKITLPMISPILLLNTVYTIIVAMTENSSIMKYIIDKGFYAPVIMPEYSAAMGWVYFISVLAFVLLVFLFMRPAIKRVSEN